MKTIASLALLILNARGLPTLGDADGEKVHSFWTPEIPIPLMETLVKPEHSSVPPVYTPSQVMEHAKATIHYGEKLKLPFYSPKPNIHSEDKVEEPKEMMEWSALSSEELGKIHSAPKKIPIPLMSIKERFAKIKALAKWNEEEKTSLEREAKTFLTRELKLNPEFESLEIEYSYKDVNDISHIYGKHLVDSTIVSNHDFALHYTDHVLLGWSSNFASAQKVPSRHKFDKLELVGIGEDATGLKHDSSSEATTKWIEDEKGFLIETISFQVKSKEDDIPQAFILWVSTQDKAIIQAVSLVSEFTFHGVPLPRVSPNDRSPEQDILEPIPELISDWSKDRGLPETSGNNAIATATLINPTTLKYSEETIRGEAENPELRKNLDLSLSPTSAENPKASTIHAFAIINWVHDILYAFGFNEDAGNLQELNDNGSKGGGVVHIHVQSKPVRNNAYMTPGIFPNPSHLTLSLSTRTSPLATDLALDNSVLLHEYTHAVSQRLIGGPKADSLKSPHSRGLAEGFSDTIAMFSLQEKESLDRKSIFKVGEYVNLPRLFNGAVVTYSTDLTKNRLYKSDLLEAVSKNDIYGAGAVWATAMNEVYWNLRDYFAKNGPGWLLGHNLALELVLTSFSSVFMTTEPTYWNARLSLYDAAVTLSKKYSSDILQLINFQCCIDVAMAKRGFAGIEMSASNSFEYTPYCRQVCQFE